MIKLKRKKLNLIIYFNLIYFCHWVLLIKVEMRSSLNLVAAGD